MGKIKDKKQGGFAALEKGPGQWGMQVDFCGMGGFEGALLFFLLR